MKLVKNHLEPSAQPWIREVESSVGSLENIVTDIQESDRSQGVMLGAITSTIEELRSQQTILSEQQAELAQAQLTIENTQTRLSEQVTRIDDLVTALPTTRTYSSRVTNIPLPSGTRTAITITIPWVEGKTRCEVSAIATATYWSQANQANLPAWRIVIQGTNGPVGIDGFFKMDTYNSTAMHSKSVTAQGQFTVLLQTVAGAGNITDPDSEAQLQVVANFN